MRECAKVLQTLRCLDDSGTTMSDFISPSKYNTVLEAVATNMGAPSTAVKIRLLKVGMQQTNQRYQMRKHDF